MVPEEGNRQTRVRGTRDSWSGFYNKFNARNERGRREEKSATD